MTNSYAAMTINERLYLSGLLDEFDKAVDGRDPDKIRDILRKVEVSDETSKQILRQLGF